MIAPYNSNNLEDPSNAFSSIFDMWFRRKSNLYRFGRRPISPSDFITLNSLSANNLRGKETKAKMCYNQRKEKVLIKNISYIKTSNVKPALLLPSINGATQYINVYRI